MAENVLSIQNRKVLARPILVKDVVELHLIKWITSR